VNPLISELHQTDVRRHTVILSSILRVGLDPTEIKPMLGLPTPSVK
jgi:hypothetical protein